MEDVAARLNRMDLSPSSTCGVGHPSLDDAYSSDAYGLPAAGNGTGNEIVALRFYWQYRFFWPVCGCMHVSWFCERALIVHVCMYVGYGCMYSKFAYMQILVSNANALSSHQAINLTGRSLRSKREEALIRSDR